MKTTYTVDIKKSLDELTPILALKIIQLQESVKLEKSKSSALEILKSVK